MLFKSVFLVICIYIYAINAALLFWSNKKLHISPLLPFDDEDLENLVHKLDNPKLFTFKVHLQSHRNNIPTNIKQLLKGYHSAYNPNGNIATSKAIELKVSKECNGIDISKIQNHLFGVNNTINFIAVIDISYSRRKRDLSNDFALDKLNNGSIVQEAVIYRGQNQQTKLYALLYSSKPLMLTINRTRIYLGNIAKDMINVDTRLNVNIPLGEGEKVSLRFNFSWSRGYWYLPSVRITHSNTKINEILSTEEDIMAPSGFSYHCNGQSIFSNATADIELRIYDLQVQVNSKNGKFGDAYDCVPFMTVPIWSGLFITSILGLALVVALTALMDIKTLDKFDNYKTKNLSITVFD
ncbi:uncharacterized protein LOC132703344 [Cylas formicarius]|uniref:uncharacterized protein LOC132703344 n=1 Tax=Cylas formicarius TaxID=197179 RepID=UPI002958B67F|nr:uncharacterized protein LOC132703344 [Cylas formicarius]